MKRMSLWIAALGLIVAGRAYAEEGEGKARPSNANGTITKVDAGSITIEQRKEGAVAAEHTFTLNADTKVSVPTDQTEEVTGEGGSKRTRTVYADGKIDDLKVVQRVTVTYDQNKVASKVVVAKVEQKRGKEGGEGGRAPEAQPPRKREGGEG